MPRKLSVALAVVAGLFAGACIPRYPAATAVGMRRPPSSVDATGTRDVSLEMNAFFASVPDGSVVSLAPGGRYRVEGTLLLRGRHHLEVDGNGATLFATTPGSAWRSHVRVESSSYIVIRNLIVRGANPRAGVFEEAYQPAREHQHGFDILSSTRVKLLAVTVTDTYGDFVYLGQLEDGPLTSRVIIRDSRFERNGRQGVALTAARRVLIERNYFGEVRRATFDFEPEAAGAGVGRVRIRDNVVGPGRLMFVAAAGSGPVQHVTIASNRLRGQSLQVYVHNNQPGKRNDWKIVDNRSDEPLGNPHGSAMRFWRVNGLVVSGTVQPFQAGRNMVIAGVTASCAVTVAGNERPNSVGEARFVGSC